MRLLHTSDWHLGRTLHGADLRDAQAAVVDAVVDVVAAEGIDVVLVAGDVFDRAVPPPHAVELWQEALRRLAERGTRVVVSSGNHDSAIRLGAHHGLIDAAGVHLRTRPSDLATPVVVDDAHGAVGVYAIPYLEPHAAWPLLMADADSDSSPDSGPDNRFVTGSDAGPATAPHRGHAAVLRAATERIARDAHDRGLGRTVVLAHAWVTGGEACDSERDIAVGGLAQAPAELFAPFSYTALGHLHGRQRVTDSVRYSGSPLAYSFSEARHRKGWWVVDLDARGAVEVRGLDAPVPRRLSTLTGTLEELLTSREHAAVEQDWLAVTLTDAARPVEAMAKLQQRFPHTLTISFAPPERSGDGLSYTARVVGRTDLELATSFVAHTRGTEADEAERVLLQTAFDAVRTAGDEPLPSAGDEPGSAATVAPIGEVA